MSLMHGVFYSDGESVQRRVLALLTALIMLIAVLPSAAVAEGWEVTPEADGGSAESPASSDETPAEPVATPAVYSLACEEYPITVTSASALPEGARLAVRALDEAEISGMVAEGMSVVLAYDIKIMVPGDPETEYQPPEGSPVTVSVSAPALPPAAELAVTHIELDDTTGEVVSLEELPVIPTDDETVQFETEGFSVFIISVMDTDPVTHTVNFPMGDYTVSYRFGTTGAFMPLTSSKVSVGTLEGTKYNTLYFTVTPNDGFTIGTVEASSGTLSQASGIYTLALLGAAASIDITIPVTGVKITGAPARGGALTAVPSNLTAPVTYEWQSCSAIDGTYEIIAGQSEPTFILPDTDEYNGMYIKAIATDGASVEFPSAPVGPIVADGTITFDLAMGGVEIGLHDGTNYTYRGYNSAGALVTGVHTSSNVYKITGTTGDPEIGGGNNVTLSGGGDFNVELHGAEIYTGTTNSGVYAPVSTRGVNGTGSINITLFGVNRLKNVSLNPSSSCAALEKGASESTLVIGGSGTLYATGGADSAGIGGSDTDRVSLGATKNITINSGTIYATTTGSQGAGIGAGNNQPAYIITINGGTIEAIGIGNGAGIGGSGGISGDGREGVIIINGGTITASSNGTGAGIGGGGSNSGTGGNGTVIITDGNIVCDIIGGGSNNTGSLPGGSANVTIEGGHLVVSDALGGIIGGSSGTGIGGSITVEITGGTVITPRISGGQSGDGTYQDATLSVSATASVNIADRSNITSISGPDPFTSETVPLYLLIIDVSAIPAFESGGYENIAVSGIVFTDDRELTLDDVYTDGDGLLYFWLPADYHVKSVIIAGQTYDAPPAFAHTATVAYTGRSTVDAVFTIALNYGTAESYEWQISPDGASFTPITGETATSYTVKAGDVGQYVRASVRVEGETDPIISNAVLITATPSANIVYDGATAGNRLTAQLLNGTAATYAWQSYNSGTSSWVTFATTPAYTTNVSDVGKLVHVRITDEYRQTYTSSTVLILAPQINVSVPIKTVVTVSADGKCTVPSGNLVNNSLVNIYLTGVTFAWDAGAAGAYFNDYSLVSAGLTLGGTSVGRFSGATPAALSVPAGINTVAPTGTLPIVWDFNMNKAGGNYIKLASAAGVETALASVTFTVTWEPPA